MNIQISVPWKKEKETTEYVECFSCGRELMLLSKSDPHICYHCVVQRKELLETVKMIEGSK